MWRAARGGLGVSPRDHAARRADAGRRCWPRILRRNRETQFGRSPSVRSRSTVRGRTSSGCRLASYEDYAEAVRRIGEGAAPCADPRSRHAVGADQRHDRRRETDSLYGVAAAAVSAGGGRLGLRPALAPARAAHGAGVLVDLAGGRTRAAALRLAFPSGSTKMPRIWAASSGGWWNSCWSFRRPWRESARDRVIPLLHAVVPAAGRRSDLDLGLEPVVPDVALRPLGNVARAALL